MLIVNQLRPSPAVDDFATLIHHCCIKQNLIQIVLYCSGGSTITSFDSRSFHAWGASGRRHYQSSLTKLCFYQGDRQLKARSGQNNWMSKWPQLLLSVWFLLSLNYNRPTNGHRQDTETILKQTLDDRFYRSSVIGLSVLYSVKDEICILCRLYYPLWYKFLFTFTFTFTFTSTFSFSLRD